MFVLHDTVARAKVPLVPREPGRVSLYACGPTVYRRAHIGNLRTYLLADILVRALRHAGIRTFTVQNITDMGHMHDEALERGEDRVVAAARAAGTSAREIAERFTDLFFRDCARMAILPADVHPRASAHVPEMIALVRALEERGATYGRDGYLYLDVTKAPGYGRLSGAVLGEGEAAERTDPAIHRHKRRPEDFALWLPAGPGREFRWESPWGPGWPGWHVECAAMALKYLGSDFDVHAGGSDLRFPHHENSRAMAVAATGGSFAALWIHAAHLLVEGRKMSKSLRNEYTLDDLEARGFSPADFRYHCLTLHYRTPMNFTWEGLSASARALARLKDALSGGAAAGPDRGGDPEAFDRAFREALAEDLNAPRAVAVLHEAARAGLAGAALRRLAASWDEVLAVGLPGAAPVVEGEPRAAPAPGTVPPEVAALSRRREACRKEGRFAEADALREEIRAAGYEVEDARGGAPRIRKVRGGEPAGSRGRGA